MTAPPLDGGYFIADTSAWWRSDDPTLADEWDEAVAEGQIAICAPVEYELLTSARNEAHLLSVKADLQLLPQVPVRERTLGVALLAQQLLAAVTPLYHRPVSFVDAVVAAAAAESGLGVLHCDRHYDRLAVVLGFESRRFCRPSEAGVRHAD